MNMAKSLLFSLAVFVVLGLNAAEQRCFINASGDGKWSNKSNWLGGAMPVSGNGDVVIVSNTVAGAEFENDIENLAVGNLKFHGPQVLTLNGNKLSVNGDIILNCRVTNNIDIVFVNDYPDIFCGDNYTHGNKGYYGVFNGDISAGGAEINIGGACGGEFHGSIIAPNSVMQCGNLASATYYGAKTYNFYGPVCASKVTSMKKDDSSLFTFHSQSNVFSSLTLGRSYFHCGADNVLPTNTVLKFMRHLSTTEKNILRLYGFDQTIDRISGGLVNGKDIDKITTTAPARLELRGSADAETSCLVGDGEITLVWNPSGPFTQTFRERANTTSGEIIVSNGVFKVSDFATFANVKRIVVAPDAVFDMTTATSSGALAGCTTIEVGRGGKFLLGDGAENVFTDNQLTLKLSSLGEFCLNAEDYLFARVEVDGVLLAGGQYASGTGPFTGSGSFSVPESEVETTSVLWVGQGENVLSSTALNWEGGETPNFLSRGLLPIFATSGVLAEIDTAMDLKGIRFAGASQEFMLRSASPESKIAIRTEGVAVEVSHKAIVDVPLEVKCDQTWNVGKNASLVISNAATMAFTYAVTNIGLGELVLCSSNNNFKGAFHVGTSSVTGGTVKVYAPENAFGPECDEELVVHMYSPAGGSSSESANFGKLYLYGTKIERPVLFTGQGNNYQPLWSATGTNIFTKSVNWSSHFRPKVSENSVLIWEGGATGHNWFMPYSPQGSENAVLCIRNRPADFAYFHLSVTPQIRLEVAGNNYSTLEFISGELVFGVDWAFNKNGDKVYFSSKLAVFDLNGYNQRIANIFKASGATVRSRSGAQLHLSQTNAQAVDSSGGIEFTGGAGLTYEGGKDFTIDLAMSSTGKVEVVSKTLRFSETGSWKKAAAVAVSGNGCIDISRRGIFGGKAAFSADGNGVFLLGEGVAQKCRSLTVGSYQVPPGRYGGADCAFENVDKTYASHFSGSGVLIVGDCSLSIVVR